MKITDLDIKMHVKRKCFFWRVSPLRRGLGRASPLRRGPGRAHTVPCGPTCDHMDPYAAQHGPTSIWAQIQTLLLANATLPACRHKHCHCANSKKCKMRELFRLLHGTGLGPRGPTWPCDVGPYHPGLSSSLLLSAQFN